MAITTRRQFLATGLAGIAASCTGGRQQRSHDAYNVLFIAVDDLRPVLGCYGNPVVRTPHIDALASRGTLFQHAYCQMPICSPSRTSLLTGLRPDTTGITDMSTHFRATTPGAVTLPEQFKMHGRHTQGLDKIFHPGFDDPQSWSVPHWESTRTKFVDEDNLRIIDELKRRSAAGEKNLVKNALPWEAPDVPDSAVADGHICDKALDVLPRIAAHPFFLAVGFRKPHLPFSAPKRYWDLYRREDIPLAINTEAPNDAPSVALENWTVARNTELRQYYGVAPDGAPVTDEQARTLVHGYYACVSLVDAQVGRLMEALDRLQLRDNTIVVFWGDHGFHLGEHGAWAKHTHFEESTRCPLIVCMPGQSAAGQTCPALVELVDIYPTLCSLAGIPLPESLEGVSFHPLLDAPDRRWKTAVFSQISRNDMGGHGRGMGYSIRTDRYRFNRWAMPGAGFRELELYDLDVDPGENFNLARRPEYAEMVNTLEQRLDSGWKQAVPPVL